MPWPLASPGHQQPCYWLYMPDKWTCFPREQVSHDDVIKWKHIPRNWPFVRGIHRSRWIPHTKASDAELWCFFDLRLNKRLSKQPWGWWSETPSSSLWRHRNDCLRYLNVKKKCNLYIFLMPKIDSAFNRSYRQVSNISSTLVGNKIVDHSDVVGASPVGAAPTTSSFS